MIHCHILEHEDQGMMGIFEITGTEGATYTDAETLDPTCYRDSTRGFTGATFAPTSAPVADIGSAMRDRRGGAERVPRCGRPAVPPREGGGLGFLCPPAGWYGLVDATRSHGGLEES